MPRTRTHRELSATEQCESKEEQMNAQTEESESISQSMEKIADAAAPAPNIRMIYDHTAALKARSDIPAEYDKRFPRRKHVWQSSRIGQDVLKRGGYDVIRRWWSCV